MEEESYTYTTTDEADIVNASISYTLGNNLENLNLTGPFDRLRTGGTDLNGTGNELTNASTATTAQHPAGRRGH